MIVSVHQPQYIPWLGYFDKIRKSDCFVFLDRVQYKEREFQNRNKILTRAGWIWLTVPVISKGLGRQLISGVEIDNSAGWGREHSLSIKSAYGRAEFWPLHAPFFEDLYARQWKKLAELNVHIIEYLMKTLAITTPVRFEAELGICGTKTDRIIEICAKLKADTYLSGAGGRDYLEEDKFTKAGIKLEYQDFVHPVYRQQFMKTKEDFQPHMSALDLIFNEGPSSGDILGKGGPKA